MFRLSVSLALLFPAAAGAQFCGEPLADAQLLSFTLPVSTAQPAGAKKSLFAASSRARLAQLRMALGPLDSLEQEILAKAAAMQPALVSRVAFDKLGPIMQAGALVSPNGLKARGLKAAAPFTPEMENSLYGAYSCVFASYGPPDGRKRYGDVVIRLREPDLRANYWVTFSSGWYWVKSRRGEVRADMKLTDAERLGYAATAFTGADAAEAFRYSVIAYLRGLSFDERNRVGALLRDAPDARTFYSVCESEEVGYFEAKIDDAVPSSAIESIEVPADKFEAARKLGGYLAALLKPYTPAK